MDVEYGRERPRFTTHIPNPSSDQAQASEHFYAAAWEVYHSWVAQGRSPRDCRIAELFAAQSGSTGTVRGIVMVLKSENLSPNSTGPVQKTLKEIQTLARSQIFLNSSTYTASQYASA